ncbi:MAG: SGNH/GDSL hydrolase family protein [Balneolales bacterium]
MTCITLLLNETFVSETDENTAPQKSYQPHFELKDGDRVVFLGNSLMEKDLKHGYLEVALTSRWPNQDITFRNLGWSGDTVFGDARSYFTNPPSAYGHLVNQLNEAQPTVVFIAYGANEASEGEAGIPGFSKGLNQLLTVIEDLEAKAILLSPVPHFTKNDSDVKQSQLQNENLKRYSEAISETALERDVRFINLFHSLIEIGKKFDITTNGIHLNETGYYFLSSIIETGLGLPSREWSAQVDVSDFTTWAKGATISDVKKDKDTGNIQFSIDDHYLPYPLPAHEQITQNREIKMTGLNKGSYSLTVDGEYFITATSSEWSEGVKISNEPSYNQANHLRDLIVKKNELYFHKYRPQNRTYLLGFRSHEQGHNAVELNQFDSLIQKAEDQIANYRMPNTNNYKLIRQ